jgi:hypothetical protein
MDGGIDDGDRKIDRPSCYCTWDYLIPQAMPRRPLKEEREWEKRSKEVW